MRLTYTEAWFDSERSWWLASVYEIKVTHLLAVFGLLIPCLLVSLKLHARIQRGEQELRTPPPIGCAHPPEKIGFISKACPDPLKNHKTTKPAFIVGPYQCCLNPLSPQENKPNQKTHQNWTPTRKSFWIGAWMDLIYLRTMKTHHPD